jgi:hypothetical protein
MEKRYQQVKASGILSRASKPGASAGAAGAGSSGGGSTGAFRAASVSGWPRGWGAAGLSARRRSSAHVPPRPPPSASTLAAAAASSSKTTVLAMAFARSGPKLSCLFRASVLF